MKTMMTMKTKRALWIAVLAVLVGIGLWSAVRWGGRAGAATAAEPVMAAVRGAPAADAPLVTVYKSATCECCGHWAKYLGESGFRVEIVDGEQVAERRTQLKVPYRLLSCHSATVDGYVLEGHVPADVIWQLLREKPKVAGLAVPGMPEGVPGMPPAGPNRPLYDVIAFEADGGTRVYAKR